MPKIKHLQAVSSFGEIPFHLISHGPVPSMRLLMSPATSISYYVALIVQLQLSPVNKKLIIPFFDDKIMENIQGDLL